MNTNARPKYVTGLCVTFLAHHTLCAVVLVIHCNGINMDFGNSQ